MAICMTVHIKGTIKVLKDSEVKFVLVAALGDKEADGFAPDISKKFDQDTVINIDHTFGDCRNFKKTDTMYFKIKGSKERLNIEKDLNIKIPSLKVIWDKLPDVTINIKEIKLIDFCADYDIEVEVNVYN
ncbi:hypothetical protein [Ammoniphilus sp. 3BR4]|uniref:hypothetical protein n=1 Tax=Ammoniphilus sp. 3BR4 TaxID=3158265 RepID=UPI003467A1C0